MEKYFRDYFIDFEQKEVEDTENIFELILNDRKKGLDKNRFFLSYIPREIIEEYDFANPTSLKEFRRICLTLDCPIMQMGGCNLDPDALEKDRKSGYLRYAGIKLSDPYGKIYGSFDIRNHNVTYSPLFSHFYEERDLNKFAHDTYFTTMTFEKLMEIQIKKAQNCFVHIGDVYEIGRKSPYNLEEVTKEQMLDYIYNKELGEEIYKRVLRIDKK